MDYRRLKFDHSGPSDAAVQYGTGAGKNVDGFLEIENVDVTANNTNVFLVWDNRNTTETEKYGLTGVQNLDNENSTSWDSLKPLHITSVDPANPGEPLGNGNRKLSKGTVSNPPEENALRPSVAVSSSNFWRWVWQQRPLDNCDEGVLPPFTVEDNSSEIFLADHSANSWAGWGVLTDTTKAASLREYSIDPDLAVDSAGPHFVFMKDANSNLLCNGGDQNDFAVFYRGQFEAVQPSENLFLPIIVKNS